MSIARRPRKPLTKIVDFEEMELSLDAIKVHPEMLQVRARTDKKVSQRYSVCRSKGSVFPPVLVYRVGEDLYLTDGFHRYDAWVQLGLPTIPAVIRDGTMEDALLAAIEANGDDVVDRKLNDADRKHVVEMMIKNEKFRKWSDSEIGRRCGISHSSVKSFRLALVESEGVPLPDRVIAFSEGKPNGKSSKYAIPKGKGVFRPHVSEVSRLGRRTVYCASIDGKSRDLAFDAGGAERWISDESRRRELLRDMLSDLEGFAFWLRSQLIHSKRFASGTHPGGVIEIGDTLVRPIAVVSQDTFLIDTARLLWARASIGNTCRLILVGYVRGQDSVVSKYLRFAPALGIEVMTPEEFVAEFGPKGDDQGDTQPPSG